MSSQFTDKQKLFITWYVKLLNATEAARRAGYGSDPEDRGTLEALGHETLRNPKVRSEIDRLLTENIPSANETLARIGQRAHVDITPYIRDDMTLDIDRLRQDGLGHLVTGIKNTRDGPQITLTDPQTASKNLARYHRILGADVQVSIETTTDKTILSTIAQQLDAIRQGQEEENVPSTTEADQDDT